LKNSVCYQSSFRAGKGAGICFFAVQRPDVTQWVKELVGKIDYTGQISFDVMAPSLREFFPIECNPRATSGVHFLAESGGLTDLLSPGENSVSVATTRPAQVALAMLFLGLPGVRTFSQLKEWLRCFFTSRDVLGARGDWGPLFGQIRSLLTILQISRIKKISLLEATTEDIQWDGENLR
jgi:hypothetical protein